MIPFPSMLIISLLFYWFLLPPCQQKELSEQPPHTDKLTVPKLSFKYVHVQPLPVNVDLSISIHVNKIIQLSGSGPKALPLLQFPTDQRIHDEWDEQRP